jgi:hypothetical protein
MQRVFEKDGVYGVILTQTELDMLTALIGGLTPAPTGTVLWEKFKVHRKNSRFKGAWTSLNEEEIEEYKKELEAIGDEYVK